MHLKRVHVVPLKDGDYTKLGIVSSYLLASKAICAHSHATSSPVWGDNGVSASEGIDDMLIKKQNLDYFNKSMKGQLFLVNINQNDHEYIFELSLRKI